MGVRGAPWAVYSPEGKRPLLMISFAHLSAAIYRAHELAPENPQVKASIAGGLPGALILHPRTPACIIRWLKDLNNNFHAGSARSFLEEMDDVIRIESYWTVFKGNQGITARGAGGAAAYEKAYSSYVQTNHPSLVKSWKTFETTKALVHILQRRKLWEHFRARMLARVCFLDSNLENRSVIYMMHRLAMTFDTNFRKTVDQEDLNLAIMAAVEFSAHCLAFAVDVCGPTSCVRMPPVSLGGI